ncbi:mitotic checkpoint regulator, MAD2B-interacting-domain-containing protein [Cristinia sonorae]|uniref:Mitotic checkpoint regulator, MAD2B-interacting-domain-containing protein n=1 Tax=Cristinia sonorae TaxID=1940300 RepID=A0A8K0UYN1_9AGAR|nr:mitotic checkpoint regulator, MAD2B-interacting-domain-containing protein [Cristinia sonorae]
MLGVEGYGSDSDNGSDNEISTPMSVPKQTSSLAAKLPAPAKKSTFSLPAPSASSSSSGPALSVPKRRAPKKITIGLPELPKDDDALEDDRPPAKKPRLEPGVGRSGLLAMLPAPKNKAAIPVKEERVLGGGKGPGLVFKTAPVRTPVVEDVEDEDEDAPAGNAPPRGNAILEEVEEVKTSASVAFLPPSLVKGRANVSTEDRPTRTRQPPPKITAAPAVDFFGLGSSGTPSSSRASMSTPVATTTPSLPSLPTISSAPKVEEFTPPEPTPNDPYPGYYQLPSGSWALYDTTYYKKFYDKWTKEYNDHVRALEKGIEKGFEGAEKEGATQEVNAQKEMEKAKVEIQDREEKKSLTSGAGAPAAAPKMNIKGAALSGRARTRHQLSTLLSEAYANREELEEKIAQGRKNRKEAGNKYGF